MHVQNSIQCSISILTRISRDTIRKNAIRKNVYVILYVNLHLRWTLLKISPYFTGLKSLELSCLRSWHIRTNDNEPILQWHIIRLFPISFLDSHLLAAVMPVCYCDASGVSVNQSKLAVLTIVI